MGFWTSFLAADAPSVESRGQLYKWMRDVITITEPRMFIAENVKGLTNLADVKEVMKKFNALHLVLLV